jgi:hypothetical protein
LDKEPILYFRMGLHCLTTCPEILWFGICFGRTGGDALRGPWRPFCRLHRNRCLTPLPFAPFCHLLLSHFLSEVPGIMAGRLRTPYKIVHGLKLGLEVSERNPTTSAVVSARCLFCVKVGRTTVNNSSRKRARTENVQYNRVPFRKKTHAEKQHPYASEECSSLGFTEKEIVF